jgi:hypothetical protein
LAVATTKPSDPISKSDRYSTPSETSMTVSSQFTPSPPRLPSPMIPFTTSRTTVNLPLVLQNSQWYCQLQYAKAFSQPSKDSVRFWRDIKRGIFFVKIGSDHLAWKLFQNAERQVAQMCEEQPFGMMRNIFATLSPANTRVCPGLRILLLRLFALTAKEKLSAQHPLTVVCHQLQLDDRDWVSNTAFQFMIDDFESRLTSGHREVFQLKRFFINLLRCSKDYPAAERASKSLMEAAEANFGDNHEWTRLAISEYIHVCHDQGRYVEALLKCHSMLDRGQQDLAESFPDGISVYVMEDMAELCEHLARYEEAVFWLERAFEGGWRVWGESDYSTLHVQEKLKVAHDRLEDSSGLGDVEYVCKREASL